MVAQISSLVAAQDQAKVSLRVNSSIINSWCHPIVYMHAFLLTLASCIDSIKHERCVHTITETMRKWYFKV